MVLGAEIIAILTAKGRKGKYVFVDNILSDFLKADDRRTPDLFLYSLMFLYSIGIIDHIDYKIKLSSIASEEQQNLFR